MEVSEQSADLSDPIRLRTQSLAIAAHEIKTPLAILAGYVELLLTHKLGGLTKRQREVLEDCERNCERLQKFVGNFLTYARQDAGKMEMDYQLGDIIECFSDIYRLFLPRFREKGVKLEFRANSAVPRFEFDYCKTQQVAIALLENALKFTPADGSVSLAVDPCVCEYPTTDAGSEAPQAEPNGMLRGRAFIRIGVADTGPGISPEYHQAVFEAFVKLSHAGQSVEGAGLGLAIARRLVEAQGGRIWIESTPSQGCNFIFVLPTMRVANHHS
jgi:two-component system, sensor histidine kinase and response regulator